MRLRGVAGIGAVALVAIAACAKERAAVTVPGPVAPAVVRSVRINSPPSIGIGGTYSFSATVEADSGVSKAVVWSAPDSTATSGTITSDGLFTSCYPGHTVEIRATSVADPNMSATKRVDVTVITLPPAVLGEITRPGAPATNFPPEYWVSKDSVSGAVDVLVGLHGSGIFACRVIDAYWLRLKSDQRTVDLPLRTLPTPKGVEVLERYRVDSRVVPNGVYQLQLWVQLSGLDPMQGWGHTITIRNP